MGLFGRTKRHPKHSGTQADTPSAEKTYTSEELANAVDKALAAAELNAKKQVVAYKPVDPKTAKRLKTRVTVGDKYAWHYGGWLEVHKFDDWKAYTKWELAQRPVTSRKPSGTSKNAPKEEA